MYDAPVDTRAAGRGDGMRKLLRSRRDSQSQGQDATFSVILSSGSNCGDAENLRIFTSSASSHWLCCEYSEELEELSGSSLLFVAACAKR